jgi:uncharacterized protein YndB with AHSA1/START domain
MINITKDPANKKLHVVRTFNAPHEKVWKAWSDSTILDQWWGPKPWRAETKIMDFKTGGKWLYAMVGPDGTKSWSKVVFNAVNAPHSFDSTCIFCDEEGNAVPGFPQMYWLVKMEESNAVTTVNVTLTFDDIAGFEKLVAMGFEGGFTMGLQQLEELLQEA